MEFIPQAKKRRKKKDRRKGRSSGADSSQSSILPELQDGSGDIEAEMASDTAFQRREKRFTLKSAPKLSEGSSSDRFGGMSSGGGERYSKKKRKNKDDEDGSKGKQKKKREKRSQQTFAEWAESQSREFVRPKSDLGYVETAEAGESDDEWKLSADDSHQTGGPFASDHCAAPITLGVDGSDSDLLKERPSVSQALKNGRISDLFVIELPSDLPLRKVERSAGEGSLNPLVGFGSGKIGKIRVRRSGRVEMVVGGRVYQLRNDQRGVSDVRTEAMSIRLSEMDDPQLSLAPLSGQVKPFGPIQPENHFYCLGSRSQVAESFS